MKKVNGLVSLSAALLVCVGIMLTGCANSSGNDTSSNDLDEAVSPPSEESNTGGDVFKDTEAVKIPYDTNGDGNIQVSEFPVPTGEAFGLTGDDAVLYTAAAKAQAENIIPNFPEDDTTLMLTTISLCGEYDGENEEKNYICGYGALYFYELGKAFDPQNPTFRDVGGGGQLSRITLAADGTLVDIQTTYDGDDNTKRIIELCGPLTELADAMNSHEDIPVRDLVPKDSELLSMYLEYYFS